MYSQQTIKQGKNLLRLEVRPQATSVFFDLGKYYIPANNSLLTATDFAWTNPTYVFFYTFVIYVLFSSL